MALSSCSNWQKPPQGFNSETFFYSADGGVFDTAHLDPLLDESHYVQSDEYYCDEYYCYNFNCNPHQLLLPHYSQPPMECQPFPKRQKCFPDSYYPDFTDTLFNGFSLGSCSCSCASLVPEVLPELLPPFPDFDNPLESSCGRVKETGERSVSAQSKAARERRRRITEKTQELGRLIPGGAKMNTAEMLQSAFKYVKFLQAQAGILEYMGTVEEAEDLLFPAEELEAFLTSPTVQEKLSAEEKCLVPEKFVRKLADVNATQMRPVVRDDLIRILKAEE